MTERHTLKAGDVSWQQKLKVEIYSLGCHFARSSYFPETRFIRYTRKKVKLKEV